MPYMFVISKTAGWNSVGSRIEKQTQLDAAARHMFVPYTSSSVGKRVSVHKNYHRTPLHLPLFDPFTVNAIQAMGLRRMSARFDAVVAGHITQAAAMLGCKPPLFAFVDVTRHLHQRDFGDRRITDRAIGRERRVFERVSHIISMSQWAADDIVHHYGIPASKVTVIPPPAQSKSSPARPCLKPNSDRCNVLFIGSDFERKGGARLIKWQQAALHENVHLHVVTGASNIDRSIPNTTWLGDQPNAAIVQEILPKMDILCLPTLKDCSPVVLVEAAMAGIPVVASDIGGVSELIEHNVTGLLCAANDEEGFVRHLLTLSRDRELLNTMSANARHLALERFSEERVYLEIVRVVKSNI